MMKDIIRLVREKYLIGKQEIYVIEGGDILFIEEDGERFIQTEEEFINDYISFLEDLYELNKNDREYCYCGYILKDLELLYKGLKETKERLVEPY